jgi:hypothetical protein
LLFSKIDLTLSSKSYSERLGWAAKYTFLAWKRAVVQTVVGFANIAMMVMVTTPVRCLPCRQCKRTLPPEQRVSKINMRALVARAFHDIPFKMPKKFTFSQKCKPINVG